MKQKSFISKDHWLTSKVLEVKNEISRSAQSNSEPEPSAAVLDHKLDKLQQVAEGVAEEPVAEVVAPAEENLPAPAELPPAEPVDETSGLSDEELEKLTDPAEEKDETVIDPDPEFDAFMLSQEEALQTASAVSKILGGLEPESDLESMAMTASVN